MLRIKAEFWDRKRLGGQNNLSEKVRKTRTQTQRFRDYGATKSIASLSHGE